jgi:hypothetical protein
LAFSAEAYGAISLEIPKDFSLLAGLISVVTDPVQSQLSAPPEYVMPDADDPFLGTDRGIEGAEAPDLEAAEEGSDPQLQLL